VEKQDLPLFAFRICGIPKCGTLSLPARLRRSGGRSPE